MTNRIEVSFVGSFLIPKNSLGVVDAGTFPFVVTVAKITLCLDMAFLCGIQKQLECRMIIFLYAVSSFLQQVSKQVRTMGITFTKIEFADSGIYILAASDAAKVGYGQLIPRQV